jgi:peroxiredoxin
MYGEFTENGIEVFAINVGEFPEKVNTFVSGYFLAYRVLLDKDASVSKSFKVTGVPTYILINKKGKIVFRDNALPLKYKDLLPE